jgi:hypothetical protein
VLLPVALAIPTIISKTENVIKDGAPYLDEIVTFTCTQADSEPFVYEWTDSDRNQKHTATLHCLPPKELYTYQPVALIPKATFISANLVCSSPFGVNESQVLLNLPDASLQSRRLPFNIQAHRKRKLMRQYEALAAKHGFDVHTVARVFDKNIRSFAVGRFGVGFASGVLGNIVGNWACNTFSFLGGCGSDYTEKFKAYDAAFNKLANWTNETDAWITRSTKFQGDTLTALNLLDRRAYLTEQNIDLISSSVARLAADQLKIGEKLASFAGNVSRKFVEIETSIEESLQISGTIWDAVTNITSLQSSQITRAMQALATLDELMQNSALNGYREYTDSQLRRQLIGTIHDNMYDEFPQTVTPFLSEIGVPPLDPEVRLARQNYDGAVNVATVHLLYSKMSGGVSEAHDLKISYRCDTDFLLDNTFPGVSVKHLFRFLGPENCYPRTTDTSVRWNCSCVISVTDTYCPNQDSDRFPWTWPETITLNTANSKCKAGGQVVEVNFPTGTGIYETSRSWNEYFGTICATSFLASTTSGTVGKKIRIATENINRYWDLTMDGSNVTAFCDTSLERLLENDNNPDRLSFLVYRIWSALFDHISPQLLQDKEVEHYGEIPTPLTVKEWPFHRRKGQKILNRCKLAYYTQVSPTAHTVYNLVKIGTVHQMKVVIDGLQTLYATNQSVPIANSTRNATFTADAITFTAFDEFTGSKMFIAGGLTKPTVVDDEVVTPIIVDAPFDSFSTSVSPQSRCGHLNYITEPVEGFSGWSIDKWLERSSALEFDPLCAQETASGYLRTLSTNSEGRTYCDLRVPHSGSLQDAQVDTVGDNDLCSLLQNFDFEVDEPNGLISFTPYQWSSQGSVRLPKGQFYAQVDSACPTSFNISRAPNFVQISFFTTSPTLVSSIVKVTSNNEDCTNLYSSAPQQYSRFQPLVVTLQPCGYMYVQLFPVYDGLNPCFSTPINAQVDYVANTNSLTSPHVSLAIRFVKDEIVADMARQINDLANFNLQLMTIPYVGNSIADIINRTRKVIDDRIVYLNNTEKGLGNSTAVMEELAQQIRDSYNATQNNLLEIARNRLELNKTVSEFKSLLSDMNATFLDLLERSIRISFVTLKLNEAIRNAINTEAESDTGCFLGLCKLFDGFGFGGGFMDALNIIWYALVIGVMCIGILYCCKCARVALRERKSSRPSRYSPVEVEMDPPEKKLLRSTTL